MIRKHACRGPELVCFLISSRGHWNGMDDKKGSDNWF